MHAHKSMYVVFFDFLKAFDSVNHRLLCVKLRAYGAHGKVVEWIQSFLAQRSFRVRVPSPPPAASRRDRSLEMVESAKDLGVFNDSSFKPSLQCKEAYARARANFFMMRRGFAILTPAIFRPLYLAMVRPHLDYAVQASFPYFQKDIKLIERMQRLATRCVKSFRRLPYPERLHELKLPSMERHFHRATLITVNKLFHGYLNLSAEEFIEPPAGGNLLGHNFKVRQPRFHLVRRKAAFAVRSAGLWNRLPSHIAEAPTVSSFKDRLDANCCSIFPDIV